jgi:hypothetical protein
MDLRHLFALATECGVLFELDAQNNFVGVTTRDDEDTARFCELAETHVDALTTFLTNRVLMLDAICSAMERVDDAWTITPADSDRLALELSRHETMMERAYWAANVAGVRRAAVAWEEAAHDCLRRSGCRSLAPERERD